MKKHSIQVRCKLSKKVLRTVGRVLRSEAVGNFCPLFCTYEGRESLVKSDEGDVSDPFRRKASYLQTLFIEVDRNKPVPTSFV